MAYPSKYYDMQRKVMFDVRFSHSTGRCPVCKSRPCGVWPDGVKRITCGSDECFMRWLPVHYDGSALKGDVD